MGPVALTHRPFTVSTGSFSSLSPSPQLTHVPLSRDVSQASPFGYLYLYHEQSASPGPLVTPRESSLTVLVDRRRTVTIKTVVLECRRTLSSAHFPTRLCTPTSSDPPPPSPQCLRPRNLSLILPSSLFDGSPVQSLFSSFFISVSSPTRIDLDRNRLILPILVLVPSFESVPEIILTEV